MLLRLISSCLVLMCCFCGFVDAGCMRPPQGPVGPTGPTGDIGPTGDSGGSAVDSYGFGVNEVNPQVITPLAADKAIEFVDGFTSSDINIDKGAFVVDNAGTYLIGWSARVTLSPVTSLSQLVELPFFLALNDFTTKLPPNPQGIVLVDENINQEVNVQTIVTLPANSTVVLGTRYENPNNTQNLLVYDLVTYIIRIQ